MKKWNDEKELKTMILKDLKDNGFKCSLKFNRGGYTTSFTLTIKMDMSCVKSYDDWKVKVYYNNDFRTKKSMTQYYYFNDGRMYTDEDLRMLSYREAESIYNSWLYEQYKSEIEDLRFNKYNDIYLLNKKGNDMFKSILSIVNVYNYDDSDYMLDYHDRGFYDDYVIKFY